MDNLQVVVVAAVEAAAVAVAVEGVSKRCRSSR